MAFSILLAVIAVYGGLAALGAVLPRSSLHLVYALLLGTAVLAALAGLDILLTGEAGSTAFPLGIPGAGFHLKADRLSGFFAVIVNTGLAAAALYGLGLDRAHALSRRVEPFIPAFAMGMNLVLVADDAFAFLFGWEMMSLASWALVVANHRDAENRKAGHVYLVMAAIGTAALILAFAGLAAGGEGFGFAAIRNAAHTPAMLALVLCAALIGAGSKAGLFPLHAWLPLAHPAAPSHVSALMSGVMTKVAVYGLIRIVFDLMGQPQWWWALPFLVLGAVTAVMGLLYALMDGDLKRVLAYSTVENIGIIAVGLGLALAFKATGLRPAAAVAMAAALLHALNHSWFKSLLFLGAGAVLHGTGERRFDRLGGLIRAMPVTAALFLVGSFAISAMPPLNGFVSEWLLFQAVLAGPQFPEPVLRFLSPAVGAMLALAAALAAACFVRAFGTAFLGRPRSEAAAKAHEAPRVQLVAMGLLGLLCALGGLFGAVSLSAVQPVLEAVIGSGVPGAAGAPTPTSLVAIDAARATYDAPTIAAFLILSSLMTSVLILYWAGKRTRRGAAWDCGYPDPSTETQYTASSFAQPLRRVYGASVFGATEQVDMPAPLDPRPARLTVRLRDHAWDWLYAAPADLVLELSRRMNRVHFLPIRSYLSLMFAALLILMGVVAVWT